MPYAYERPMSFIPSTMPTNPIRTMERFQEALAKMKLEKLAWKNKFCKVDSENMKLNKQVKDHENTLYFQGGWIVEKDKNIHCKDTAIKWCLKERKRKIEELANDALAPDKWKNVVNKLKVEKTNMEAHYGKEILKLKLQEAFGSSSSEDV